MMRNGIVKVPMIPPLEAIGSIPLAVLAVFVIFVAAVGLGDRVLLWISSSNTQGLDRQILSVVLGLNLIGFIGVSAGMMNILQGSNSIWLLIAICGLHLTNGPPKLWRMNIEIARTAVYGMPRGTILAVFIAAVTLGPALCYPTGWDELVYHGVLPRRWAVDGRPLVYSDLVYSGFPSLCEVLCWLIAPIESVIAPRLLNWCCWLLSLLSLYRLLRLRHVPGGSAVAISSAFAVSPVVLLIGANCYVETILMMNVACLLLVIETSESARSNPPAETFSQHASTAAILVGIFSGAAAAAKLTGLVMLVVPAIWYMSKVWPFPSQRHAWGKLLAIYLTTTLCFVAPFYVRPFLASGNPFYPYFSHWLTTNPVEVEVSRFHHFIGSEPFGVKSFATFVTGPVLLTFNEDLYDGYLGWQFLIIMGLAGFAMVLELFGKVPPAKGGAAFQPKLSFLAVCLLMLYTFWFLTAQQARFIIAALVPLIVIAGYGICELGKNGRRLAVVGLLISSVVSLPWRTAGYYLGSWETMFGYWSWNEYVDDGTGGSYVPMIEAVRTMTPIDARVMLLFEHRGLYIPRAHEIGTPYFQASGLSSATLPMSSASLLTQLRTEAFTHVVMANSPIGPDRATEWYDEWDPLFKAIDDAVQQGLLKVLWISEEHAVLEVVDE